MFFGLVQGPKVPVQKLAPSLVEFLEASLHGHQDDGPKGEAFDVLQNALSELTLPGSPSNLADNALRMLVDLKQDILQRNCREEEINVEIAQNLVLNLTGGSCVLNSAHRQALKAKEAHSKRLLLPEDVNLQGLAFGKLIITYLNYFEQIWKVLNFACCLGQ